MIKIILENKNNSELDIFEQELNKIQGIHIEKIEQSGFDGLELIYYFITAGGAVCLITSIKDIIIKMIERNKNISIKINDIEIKGCSVEEAKSLLDKIHD